MDSVTSIMIVGVGGQGTLLASRILGHVLMQSGLDVKVSEVHGMSQRGGSVVTYVKYGKQVFSPVITEGEADYILSFEMCEAARWLSFLKKDGTMVMNTQRIDPMPVITGSAEYPKAIEETIRGTGCRLIAMNAFASAKQAGNPRAVNVVLMGVLSGILGFDESVWLDALHACVPARFLDLNLTAFRLGRDYFGR